MKKNLAFIAFVAVVGLLAFLLLRGEKTHYVAPIQSGNPEEVVVPKSETLPADAVGEFGDEQPVLEQSPKTPPPPVLITVQGKYYYSEDPKSEFAGKICFEPSAQTSGVGKRFCFDNADEVFAIIGIRKGFSDGKTQCTITGPATVTVKNYMKLTGDADGYDSATLTKFADTGNTSFLACGAY